MADVMTVLGIDATLKNGEVTAKQLDVIGQKGEAATERLNGGFSKFDQQLLKSMDAVRKMTLSQMEAIEANAAFDGSFIESRAVLAAHADALAMDSAAARAMALAQADAIAMNEAFDGKFIESRAVVLAHAEALELDAAANETNATAVSGLIKSAGALVAVFGAYKAAGFAGDAITLAARYQTLGVVMDVVGKNAGDTAGQMADLQAKLQRTGISAIESRQNLIKLTEAHVDLSKASQLARVAQDAAVIGNLNSSEAFAALTQGIQTAQVRILRTIGINVNFEESYKRLAKELGTTTEALTDQEKVQARTNVVLERGVDIAGSYTAAMNTVGKELRSTERYLEDTKVKAGAAFLPEYTTLVHAYADMLKFLGENATLVTGIIAGTTAAVVALGVAAAITAIALAPITLPVIAVTATLAALGIGVGVFTKQAADARVATTSYADSLKHLSDAQLQVNLNQIHSEERDVVNAGASGTATPAQAAQLKHLQELDAQFSAQLQANRLAEKVAADKAAAAVSEEVSKKAAAYQAELDKVTALNGAFGQSAEALKILEIRYDAEKQKAKDANATLGALTDAIALQKIKAVELADAHARVLVGYALLNAAASLWADSFNKAHDPAEQWKVQAEAAKKFAESLRQSGVESAALGDSAQKWLQIFDQMTKANDSFARSLKEEGLHAIQEFARSGLASWQGFFNVAEQATTRFFDRYEKRVDDLKHLLEKALEDGKDDLAAILAGDLANAKKIAGILGLAGAGLTGFSSGQSGGVGAGVVSGVAAGLATGNPWGVLIGGLAGLTGGLLGGSAAAKQRRAAEEELTRSYQSGIDSIRNQVGDLSDLDYAIAQAKTQADAQRAQALQLYGNDSALNKYFGQTLTRLPDALKQIQELEDKRIKQLAAEAAAAKEAAAAAERLKNAQAQNGYQLRIFNATGQSDAAFDLQQSMEIQQAIADGLDAISIALLKDAQNAERGQREREKQTQILQDQLSTAQQAYDSLKQVYDSLSQFSDSLKVGQYSPLSPRQQLDTTRGQLGSLYQAALGGDQNAASQFGGAAQQFLDASRRYNASGAGYVLDYNSVTVMADALKAKFGAQMTDAQKQVSLLQQQLDVLKSIDQGTQVLVSRPNLTPQVPTPVPVGGGGPRLQPVPGITVDDVQSINDRLDALVAVSQAAANGTIAATNAVLEAVEENTTLTTRKLDSLTAATNRMTA